MRNYSHQREHKWCLFLDHVIEKKECMLPLVISIKHLRKSDEWTWYADYPDWETSAISYAVCHCVMQKSRDLWQASLRLLTVDKFRLLPFLSYRQVT